MKHEASVDLSHLMEEYYQSSSEQDIVAYIEEQFEVLKVVCPHCQSQMIQVHYDFEVPARRDTKAWEKLSVALQSKTEIDYTTYIIWHKQKIRREGRKSPQFTLLQQNLEELEKAQEVVEKKKRP
ncbi:MAG: hypothetical protein AAFR61_26455 [Bacteroidota bacterium]